MTSALIWLAVEWHRPQRRRWIAALVAAIGLLGVIAFGRTAAAIMPDADLAVAELYTELATQGRLLLGPYSRFGWHHPGPLFFYLSAPFYALAGRRAPVFYAFALAINISSILTLTWVAARERGGALLGFLLAAGCLVFAWRLPMFLASPWTAHVPILPSLAFLVLAATVANGRIAILPLLAVFASFVAQTHVGLVPVVMTTFAAVVVVAFISAADKGPFWSAVNRSAWIVIALWLLPIAEGIANHGGNISALLHFFATGDATGHSSRDAFLTWSYGLTSIFRADFILPWGHPFVLERLVSSVSLAVAQVLLLGLIAWRAARHGRRFEACVALVALLASLVTMWGVTRIRGDVLTHDLFRIASLGVLNLAIIAAAGARVVLGIASSGVRRFMSSRAAAPAYAVMCGALMLVSSRDLRSMTSHERRRGDRATIVAAYEAIRSYVNAEGIRRVALEIDQDQWGAAATMILWCQRDHIAVAVEDKLRFMFTDALTVQGNEDALVTLANDERNEELKTQPGTRVLFESSRVSVDARRIPPREGAPIR
jgi:hypothetical protein